MRKYILIAFAVLGSSLMTHLATSQTPTPFNTAIRNYAYVGKAGFNANVATISLHKSLNPAQADGGFDSGQAVTFVNGPAQDLNAAGINRLDGFMYGMEYLYGGPASASAKFYRIGANAVAEWIGIVPGPTGADAGRSVVFSFVNLASGTIDSAGNYWFHAYTYTDLNAPYSASKLDMFLGKITTLSSRSLIDSAIPISVAYYKLDISDTIIQRGFSNLISQQAALIAYGFPPTNSDGGWQDMDLHPTTREFYSYIGFPSSPSVVGNNPYPKPTISSYLIRIDHTTTPWKVTPVNTSPNTTPNREEDGAYFDSTGNFYIGFTDGQYAKVNVTTGAISSIAQSSLPLFNGNLRGDFATNSPIVPFSLTFTALPVHLTRFSAQPGAAGTTLHWETGIETGLAAYSVERATDAKTFTSYARVFPKGSNSTYETLDADVSGTVYYRLKMEFTDGSKTYSGILKVVRNGSATTAVIYPTILADGVLHISTTVQQITVNIYSVTGVRVQTFALSGESTNLYSIPLSLSSGTYLARVTDAQSGESIIVSKVIVP